MSRSRRARKNDLLSTLYRLFLILLFLTYFGLAGWWKNVPPEGRSLIITLGVIAGVSGVGAIFAYSIHRRRQRTAAWRRAMAAWNNRPSPGTPVHSVRHLDPEEFERFAAQIYAKMGYKVHHTGQSGDHGVDIELLNPNNEIELVQCKQWNKPVGEPQVRDLYGAMHHANAIRVWLWAPEGFSEPARNWAKGKPITLADHKTISRLIEIAYGR